ncbi:MAG: hypothetical protein ACPG4T_09480 [Nannocystaceae bacterium]
MIANHVSSPRFGSRASALVVGLSLVASGCAVANTSFRPVTDARLQGIGNLGARTNFELQTAVASNAGSTGSDTDDRGPKRKKSITPALFWSGIIIGAIGTGATIGVAAAGFATERKISNSFDDGISMADHQQLVDRGKTLNTISIVTTAVALAGWVMAIGTYGYDYTHCGPLAPKKRQCASAGLTAKQPPKSMKLQVRLPPR